MAVSLIAKTFFLAKKIHRILMRSLRRKKSLHDSSGENNVFFAYRRLDRTVSAPAEITSAKGRPADIRVQLKICQRTVLPMRYSPGT